MRPWIVAAIITAALTSGIYSASAPPLWLWLGLMRLPPSSRPLWQDRRGEADFFLCAHLAPIAHLGPPDLDRPNPGLDGALRSMAVTNHAVAAIRQLQILPMGDEGVGLGD
jgi:hypothetical protein